MLKKKLLVLVFILWLQNSLGFLAMLTAILSGAGMVVDFIKTLPSAVSSIKDVISLTAGDTSQSHHDAALDSVNLNGAVNNLSDIMGNYHREILQKFEEIDLKMDNLQLFASDHFQHIEELISSLPQQFDIISKKQTIGEFIMAINNDWDIVMGFLKNGADKSVYSHSMNRIMGYIDLNLIRFRAAITPLAQLSNTDFGFLTDIATLQKGKTRMLCNGETSHHSVVSIFQIIVTSEIKAFILQTLALDEKYAQETASDSSLADPLSSFWSCTPIEISVANHTIIMMEAPLNELIDIEWTEMVNQSQRKLTEQLWKYIHDLRSALTIEKRPYVAACGSADWQLHNVVISNKELIHMRYDNISYPCTPSQTTFGCDSLEECRVMSSVRVPWKVCQDINDELGYESLYYDKDIQTYSIHRKKCTKDQLYGASVRPCRCTCLHYAKFILTLMQSRVNHNYVVVAVRFQQIGSFIYIQIAEGELEANGYISNYAWVLPTQKKNGEDPFEASLTVNEGKTIALDDVQLPHGYVLTGIKLSPQLISGEKGFRIGLYGVKFDYETGKLKLTDETFALAPDSQCDGIRCSNMMANRDSSEYPLAEFRGSAYKHGDNSPSRLPSLNGLPVLPNPLSPIGGVGIFYEIAPNDTPCLSLRLFTMNYMNYLMSFEKLNPNLPILIHN